MNPVPLSKATRSILAGLHLTTHRTFTAVIYFDIKTGNNVQLEAFWLCKKVHGRVGILTEVSLSEFLVSTLETNRIHVDRCIMR